MTGTLWPESPQVRSAAPGELPGGPQTRRNCPAARWVLAAPASYAIGIGGWAVRQSHWSRVPRRHKCGRTRQEVRVRRVLLLNVTYEPLTTVGLHRAVCLVLGDKAVVVHDDADGRMLHSASSRLVVPSVIRLRRYVRIPHRSRVPLTRAALMRRDNYLCAYCGTRADTIDHVIPRSRGGQHVWENCVASCTRCNHRKADRLIEEIGWSLRFDPAAPRGAHWRLIGAAHDGARHYQ